jgi:hypothetical protein
MDAKLSELLRATLAKTDARALTWEAFDEESVRVQIGAGSLHIQLDTLSAEGEPGQLVVYSIQVADGVGRVVLETQVSAGEEGFKLCDDLFRVARKNTSDRVLDDMLNALTTPRRAS